MAFPEFLFPCVAVNSDAATETTIRSIHLMSEIHMSQLNPWIHENHAMHGEQRDHLKIHRLKHRLREIHSNRMTQKSDLLFVNHKILGIRSIQSRLLIRQIHWNRTTQRSDVLFVSHAIREIQLNHSRLLIRQIHWNRKTQRSDVLFVSHAIREIQLNHSRLLIHMSHAIRQSFHMILNRWSDGKDQLETDRQK